MTRTISYWMIAALLVAAVICILPVSGAYGSPEATTASATPVKPFVSATVSAASVTAGTPVTVSGVAQGASAVQIWAFAGNYVNVTSVPVSADGKYSKTYDTTGLPAATYYVVVQNPGSDSTLSVTTSGLSGAVVDTKTGSPVFNFTGTGSVQDAAAVTALSAAFNARGADDIYTKASFAITAPEPTTMMPGSDRDAHGCIGSAGYTWCEAKQKCLREWEEPCTGTAAGQATAAPAATKSPLPAFAAIAAVLGACAILVIRKNS